MRPGDNTDDQSDDGYFHFLAPHPTEGYAPLYATFSLSASSTQEFPKDQHPTSVQANVEHTRLDGNSEHSQVHTRGRSAQAANGPCCQS